MTSTPCFDLADPAFDVTSKTVHTPRDQSWYAGTNYGWAVLRYAETSALLKDRRFRQGNAQWPAPAFTTASAISSAPTCR